MKGFIAGILTVYVLQYVGACAFWWSFFKDEGKCYNGGNTVACMESEHPIMMAIAKFDANPLHQLIRADNFVYNIFVKGNE